VLGSLVHRYLLVVLMSVGCATADGTGGDATDDASDSISARIWGASDASGVVGPADGRRVTFMGLQRNTDLNGHHGVVLSSVGGGDRFEVHVDAKGTHQRRKVRVRSCHLRAAGHLANGRRVDMYEMVALTRGRQPAIDPGVTLPTGPEDCRYCPVCESTYMPAFPTRDAARKSVWHFAICRMCVCLSVYA
jgi:hypothetical protein